MSEQKCTTLPKGFGWIILAIVIFLAVLSKKTDKLPAKIQGKKAQEQKKLNDWKYTTDGAKAICRIYLKQIIKDPDSFQEVGSTPLTKLGKGYTFIYRYRAKNSFGATVLEIMQIQFDNNMSIIKGSCL